MAYHHPGRRTSRKADPHSVLDKVTIPALAGLTATGTHNARLSDWLEVLRRQLSFWAGAQTQTPEGALRQWMELYSLDYQASTEADLLMIWDPRWTSPQKSFGATDQPSLF